MKQMFRVIYYWSSTERDRPLGAWIRCRSSYTVLARDRNEARRAADLRMRRAHGPSFKPDHVLYEDIGELQLEWNGTIDESIWLAAKDSIDPKRSA